MAEQTKPIPSGYTAITPYIMVRDVPAAVAFYKQAFGAQELLLEPDDKGNITGAQLQIGGAALMLGQAADIAVYEPSQPLPQVTVFHYVEDVDAVFERVIAAGATSIMPVEDKYYGERMGGAADPFGIVWWISTHTEDMTMETLQARALAFKNAKSAAPA